MTNHVRVAARMRRPAAWSYRVPASGGSAGSSGGSPAGGGSGGGPARCEGPNSCTVAPGVTNVQLVAGIAQYAGTATLTYQTPATMYTDVEVVELQPIPHDFPAQQNPALNQSESQTIDSLAPWTKAGLEICTILPPPDGGPLPPIGSAWTCVSSPIVTTPPPPPQVDNVIVESNPDKAEIEVSWRIMNVDGAHFLDVARYIVPKSLSGSANACQVNQCTSDKDWYSGPCNSCTTASISLSATDLDDTSMAAGTYYQYEVCYDTACAYSQPVETWKADYIPILTNGPSAGHLLDLLQPAAPSSVKVTADGSCYDVSWSDADTSITSYDVQALSGPALTGHWVVVGSTTKQELSVQLPDGFVSVGSQMFQVCAINQYGRTCSDSVHP